MGLDKWPFYEALVLPRRLKPNNRWWRKLYRRFFVSVLIIGAVEANDAPFTLIELNTNSSAV